MPLNHRPRAPSTENTVPLGRSRYNHAYSELAFALKLASRQPVPPPPGRASMRGKLICAGAGVGGVGAGGGVGDVGVGGGVGGTGVGGGVGGGAHGIVPPGQRPPTCGKHTLFCGLMHGPAPPPEQ